DFSEPPSMNISLSKGPDEQGPSVAETPSPVQLRITKTKAYSYRVPRERTLASPYNFLVELHGVISGDAEFIGVGEGQPRGQRTGDEPGTSWTFLEAAIADLEDRRIPVESPAASIT